MEVPFILPEVNSNACLFTLLALIIISTSIRFLYRGILVRALGTDDILIALAMLTAIIQVVCQYEKNYYTYRVLDSVLAHGGKLNPKAQAWNLVRDVRYAFVGTIAYLIELPLIKCSILAFYRRLVLERRQRFVLYAVMFCIVANSIAQIITKFVQIDPFKAMWYLFVKSIPFRQRASPEKLEVANSAFQAVADLVMLLLPIPFIYKVKLPNVEKASLVLVYCFGFVSFAATLLRLQQSVAFRRSSGMISPFAHNLDLTVSTQIELGMGILCANAPTLFAFFRHKPWTKLSSYRSSSKLITKTKDGRDSDTMVANSRPTSSQDRNLPDAHDGVDRVIIRSTEFHVDVEKNGARHGQGL